MRGIRDSRLTSASGSSAVQLVADDARRTLVAVEGLADVSSTEDGICVDDSLLSAAAAAVLVA